MAQPHLSAPTFEHHPDGFGIGHSRPRISWRFLALGSAEYPKNWMQHGYTIEISKSGDESEEPRVFTTESSESVLVPWPGDELRSREAVSVRVKAYSVTESEKPEEIKSKQETEWSPWSRVEAALLSREEWKAAPIASVEKYQDEGATLRPVRFRKEFSLPAGEKTSRARLYITAFGVYEAYINGSRVGDHRMGPGWTSYTHRLNYQVFDVTELLAENNVLAVEVAEGWYAGRLGFERGRCFYGDEVGVLAQLEIDEQVVIATDESWICGKSAILSSELYDGEVYDMRDEPQGDEWNTVDLDEGEWDEVKVLPFPTAKLVVPDAPPVRVTDEIKAINIFKSPSGKTIVDFGQNLVGVVRVASLNAPTGQRVSFSHAEVLEDGELAIRPLRDAKCTDTIISSGDILEQWSPKYTFHGFQYVQVDGWPNGTPQIEDITALVLHTDMRRRGWFSCSNALVNKLHENVVWGMRGNFLSIPTDCPQRDERLGWTGDIQIFAQSATFLYDTIGMLSCWLEDVAAEQLARDDKTPGLVVPDVLPDRWPIMPQAVWHDVVVLTPWDLYLFSSDPEILRRQLPSMKAWLDIAIARGPDFLWDPSIWQLGDWLDPAAPADDPGNGRTDGVLVADAYLVHITNIFASICDAIGKPHEAAYYRSDHAMLLESFQEKYITPAGLLANQTQTALSLVLTFGLYPENSPQLETAASALAALVRKSKFRISTGFAGTPAILPALTSTGKEGTQLAYRMLVEQHCPSWLYPVTMGATTVWERWDSLLPDGKVNPGSMTSFNHYALGSVVAWLHGTVGGISSTDGWKTVIVAPKPGGTMTSADVKFDGPFGLVGCAWSVDVQKGKFEMRLSVPPNSKAVVTLPGSSEKDGKQRAVVGSGQHTFSCQYEPPGEWPPHGGPVPFMGWEGGLDCQCGT